MNAGSGVACDYPITGGTASLCGSEPVDGNQLGRIEIAVAPSNPNVIYAQVQLHPMEQQRRGRAADMTTPLAANSAPVVSTDGGDSPGHSWPVQGGALRSR